AGAAAAGDLDPLLLGQCADPGRQSLVKRRVERAAADAEVVGAAAGSEAAERLPVAGAGLDDTAATARERVIRVGPNRIARLDPRLQLWRELDRMRSVGARHVQKFAPPGRKMQRPPLGTLPAGAAAADRGVAPRCLRVMSPSACSGPPRSLVRCSFQLSGRAATVAVGGPHEQHRGADREDARELLPGLLRALAGVFALLADGLEDRVAVLAVSAGAHACSFSRSQCARKLMSMLIVRL